jgi:predicted  nucleic acid-binding Zn-ribbon protein
MAFKKAIANVIKELIIPELSKIKDDINNVNVKLEFTNKRLGDINLQLVDQSRRIDGLREELNHKLDGLREDLTHRIDETNDRINRLYEVIVHRDEHSSLEQKVLDLERDVREIKIKIAV